jgi:predicted nucleic acid-binding Zn ribbon protein
MESLTKISRLVDILPLALKGLVNERFDALAALRGRWPEIAGTALAQRSQVVGLKDGVVQVTVQNSVWLAEMRLCRKPLLDKLKKMLPEQSWQDIKFRLG